MTVEQFDPASPRRFEIVDLTVGVRCRSALDSPNLVRVLPTSLGIEDLRNGNFGDVNDGKCALFIRTSVSGGIVSMSQGHPTTVFWEISVRSPLEWLKFSRAQEKLKISKMFRGDCLLRSEFRDLCGLFT